MTRTCLTCGWVHFGITREEAQKAVDDFNAYFEKASDASRALFGNTKASLERDYMRCRCGGSYKNFRDSRPGDCPAGVQMSPILVEKESDREP